MRPLMPWQRLSPTRASRWRNTTPFWRWRRTIPRFVKKFVSASVLRPSSRSSSRCGCSVSLRLEVRSDRKGSRRGMLFPTDVCPWCRRPRPGHPIALRPGKGQLSRRIGRERTYCTSLRLTRQQARRDLHEEEIMPHTRYIVVQHKDEWLIKFGDEEYGPYHSRAEAILFAIDAAQKLGEQGENTQVGSMGEHGRFRPEWSYGKDPYPPQGL